MSDKWMEMKQPMLSMQSHNINTISLVVFGYSLEIFYTRRTLARERMRKFSLRFHYPLYLKSRLPTEGEMSAEQSCFRETVKVTRGPQAHCLIADLYVQAPQRNWPEDFSLMLLIF